MVVSGRVDPKPEKCSPNPTLQVCGLGWVEPELGSGWVGSGCSGRVVGLGCRLIGLSGFLHAPSRTEENAFLEYLILPLLNDLW